MNYQYGSIPQSINIHGFNLMPQASSTWDAPIPPSAYNRGEFKTRRTLTYPKMTVPKISRVGCFEQIPQYIPDKIGADDEWDNPIPPEQYNKNELKRGGNSYPPINIPTMKSRVESLDDRQDEPTPKKFSTMDILTTLIQQNPNIVELKVFLRDLTFLEIAKQSRELTDDEKQLELSIKNKVNEMVSKPLPVSFPNSSSIPSKGEEPPQKGDIITDKEHKLIEKLGLDDTDNAVDNLFEELVRSSNSEKTIQQWKKEAKKVNFENLDLNKIEEAALDDAFLRKNKIILQVLKGTKYEDEAKSLYKNTIDVFDNGTNEYKAKVLNNMEKYLNEKLDDIEQEKIDADAERQKQKILDERYEKTKKKLDDLYTQKQDIEEKLKSSKAKKKKTLKETLKLIERSIGVHEKSIQKQEEKRRNLPQIETVRSPITPIKQEDINLSQIKKLDRLSGMNKKNTIKFLKEIKEMKGGNKNTYYNKNDLIEFAKQEKIEIPKDIKQRKHIIDHIISELNRS